MFFNGWWTLFIIIPCITGLFKEENKIGNIIGIIIGTMLLLSSQEIISFELIMKLLIPIVFIVIGIGIIFKDFINKTINDKIKQLNKDGLEEYYATFSEQKTKLPKEKFKGASLNAVFGSVKFDMTDSIIEKEQIVNSSSIFGGIEITVPNKINVKVKSTALFGGVSNKTTETKDSSLPTLYINSFCMFGGVDIK